MENNNASYYWDSTYSLPEYLYPQPPTMWQTNMPSPAYSSHSSSSTSSSSSSSSYASSSPTVSQTHFNFDYQNQGYYDANGCYYYQTNNNISSNTNMTYPYIQAGDITQKEDLNRYLPSSSPEEFLTSDITQINPSINQLETEPEKVGKKGSGRPRQYSKFERWQRKLISAKNSREKKKRLTKELFERVESKQLLLFKLNSIEYSLQNAFNTLLLLTANRNFEEK